MEDANGAANNSSPSNTNKEKEKQEPCNGHGGGAGRLRFPPGYRFKPTDEELIVHYLKPRVLEQPLPPNIITYIDLYDYDPDQLVKNTYGRDGGATEWFFFTPRKRKYPKGSRPCRAAGNGFWKATGADKPIYSQGSLVGCRKALVYYGNGKKSDAGTKTNWIMHEFRVAEQQTTTTSSQPAGHDMSLDKYVLCRIYNKKPRNKGHNSRQPRSIAATPPLEDEVIKDEHDHDHDHDGAQRQVDAVDVRPAQWPAELDNVRVGDLRQPAALPSNEAFNYQMPHTNIAGELGQLGAYTDLSQYGFNTYQQHSHSGPYYDSAESFLNNFISNVDGNNNFIGHEFSNSANGGLLGDAISYNYHNAERLRLHNASIAAEQSFHMQHQVKPMIPPSMCYDQVNNSIDAFVANMHNTVPSGGFGVPSSCVFPVNNNTGSYSGGLSPTSMFLRSRTPEEFNQQEAPRDCNTGSCGGLLPSSMFLSSRTPEELNPGFNQQEAPRDCSLSDVSVPPPLTDDDKSNHNNEF